MKILEKYLNYFLCGVFFFLWTVISPVAFHGEFNKSYEEVSPDGAYKIVAYDITPSTPYSVIQLIINRDIFLVLYDRNGKYLGQSSPFHFSDWDGIFAGPPMFPFEVGSTDELERSFFAGGANDYAIGYRIPVDYMHWWSRLLSVFY